MNSINTRTLLRMVEFGAKKISENFEYINELNVFPVPDGDTGINMKISITGAFEAIKDLGDEPLYDFTKKLSRQLLMNARGNSGVIFSQIFRGFFDPIKEGQEEIPLVQLSECFSAAKERSYKSVGSPVEGTILTLIRMLSEEIEKNITSFNTIQELFSWIDKRAFEIVELTPTMLVNLKEAGVVDSGAYGLATFLQGMYEALDEADTGSSEKIQRKIQKKVTQTMKIAFIDNPERQDVSEEGFGYCCEFICELNYKLFPEQLKKSNFVFKNFENELLTIGNSLVLVQDENLIKVHLHTFTPNKLLEIGQKYGEFIKVKIENMTEQFFEKNSHISRQDLLKQMKLTDKTKVIVTAPSNKFGKFLKSELGASTFINVGKIGNPSVIDFVNKIDEVKSKNIIIVIDDSNIALSAEEAIKLKSNNINFLLVKTKNPLQLMCALMTLDLDLDFRTNFKTMSKAVLYSKTCAFSTSIKTLKTKRGVHVQKGHNIGIVAGEIMVSNENFLQTVFDTLKIAVGRDRPKIFYLMQGKGTNDNDMNKIEKYVNERYGIKCKRINGDQKTYSLYIGWW